MPHQIGYVDNTPTEARPWSLAHYNLLRAIRDFCGGYGVVGTVGYSGTGNGTLTGIEASPTSVTETWTLTCTAGGATGTFSVVGSVSGAQAAATVGTPYDNGLIAFTLNDGATDFVVSDAFTVPVTQGAAATAGIAYEILRYDTSGADHQLIMKAPGLTGLEEIYLGIRTYHNVGADYYNLLGGVFTGYVAGNSFDTQPGAALVACPAHNNAIDYWLTMNGQRIALVIKLNVTVYEHLYLGKFFPYARPSQYPYPVVAGGMAGGVTAARFSTEASFDFYLRGNATRGQLRTPGGWINMHCYPWGNAYLTSTTTPSASSMQARDTGAQYPLTPVELHDNSANLYGQLDGVYHISGFDNNEENTVTIGGVVHLVAPSGGRTSHVDYCAMRLDT